MIRLVVGLGNPGQKYEDTRHNVGFKVIDEIAKRFRIRNFKEEHLSHTFTLKLSGREIVFAKPQTYMNNSGLAVINLLEENHIDPSEMLVIYDDLDLPLGVTRLRMSGSSGGHRGMESIIKSVGTENFPRLKIGIGRPKRKEDVVNYVLSPFKKDELETLYAVIHKASECVLRSIDLSPQSAMEFCNRKDIP